MSDSTYLTPCAVYTWRHWGRPTSAGLRMRMLVAACVLTGSLVSAVQVHAQGHSDDSCDDQWRDLSATYTQQSPANYQGMLSSWKSLETECAGSARYRARLALIYYFLDQPKAGKGALARIGEAEGQREPLVQLVGILTDVALLRESGQANEAGLKEIEQRVHAYVESNPTDVAGVSLLADVWSELGRHDAAIALYEQVLRSTGPSPRVAGVMRNLTITYAEAGQFQDAYELAGHAVAANREFLGDLYFVSAVARSQAAIGKIDDAKNTLTLLSLKKPEVKNDPTFREAVAFVIEKSKAAR